jgi:N-acetylmuramic acid 6-phosphate etherase
MADGSEPRAPAVGCAYFGSRIVRHVARDMEDLARRGFNAVLHTFSENDLAYYRGTMKEIVDASHANGLEVQMNPWGVGRTFGGEAESRFVLFRPDACQVLDDGRRVPAGCLNHPDYRAYCRDWADAALEAGADLTFWDEPHWVVPEHVGIDDPEGTRWGCRCDVCRERFGAEMPTELTDEVLAFREASLVDFLGEMLAHVRGRGGRSTICLLPAVEGAHGVGNWDAVAALPGLDVFATDPYWHVNNQPARPFVERYARLLAESAARAGVTAELWLPAYRLTKKDIPDFVAGVEATREAGIPRLWVWAYEACAHMSHLATPDSPDVWEAAAAAMTGTDALESLDTEQRGAADDLDRRSTLELVDLMADEDAVVPAAVARAALQIAQVIDDVVERLARGGRLIYVGAGSSGRLAAVDAYECETTFSMPSGSVVAIVAGGGGSGAEQEAAEDDDAAGELDLIALAPGERDVVVGISASGRTPYVIGALRAARAAGARTVAVTAVEKAALGELAEREIAVVVGPEVIAGSTRLKAGTAQKLVLNTISTVAMVRLGKTFGNLMVDVAATNDKLRARVRRIVRLATGAPPERADEALEAADGNAKVAIVSLLAGVDAPTARERLSRANDDVRHAIEAR